MGVYKRRNGGAKTKPRNDQILSEGENSIQGKYGYFDILERKCLCLLSYMLSTVFDTEAVKQRTKLTSIILNECKCCLHGGTTDIKHIISLQT